VGFSFSVHKMSEHSESLREHIDKAATLVEALPYIQEFRGKCFLIKLGGSAMEDSELLDALLRDVVLLEAVGINPVIVHGGGKAISEAMERSGIEPKFISGQRFTDQESIKIVENTLGEKVNSNLVASVQSHGGKAVGISGTEVFLSDRMLGTDENGNEVDLGYVGSVKECHVEALQELILKDTIPVVSPLSKEACSGNTLNTNADLAASALAGSMNVAKLVYISDVLGVMRDPDVDESLIHSICCSEVETLADEGVISGGMLPKLRSAVDAIGSGVGKIHLIDGRIPHSLLLEIFTNTGVGTEIVP
jgi:acetylglutamate kinase